MQWSRNNDDAWEGRVDGKVVAGIVKRVLPTGRCFTVFRYDRTQPVTQHTCLGVCKEMKAAQTLAKGK